MGLDMSSKSVSFFVGYGITMVMTLLFMRFRSQREKKYISIDSPKPTIRRTLSYLWTQPYDSPSKFSTMSPSSPGIPRVASQGSQLGTLESTPASRQSRRLGHWTMNRKLVLVMVGLPARGKSYIVKMLIRYLTWTGFPAKVFNVGDYRRKLGLAGVDKSFFDHENEETMKVREDMVEVVQDEMYTWLQSDDEAKVAIFDATNTTKSRRRKIMNRADQERNTLLVFIESICDDPDILAQNYKLKLQNDDYSNCNRDEALADFKERILAYEKVYETLEDCEHNFGVRYIKLYNVGQKVITRNCKGYLPSQVAFYLQNIHIGPRKIWLTRHAESAEIVYNDSGTEYEELTEEGRRYSMTIAKFIKYEQESNHEPGPGQEILILAGTRAVDCESIAHLQMLYPVATSPLLNELRRGNFSSLTPQRLMSDFPDVFSMREADKLEYRFPGEGGESYMDVIQRVRPIILELERQPRSVVVVCHLAVQRCLYAYFMGIPIKEVPYIEMPQHTLIELVPTPFGTKTRHITEEEMLESY